MLFFYGGAQTFVDVTSLVWEFCFDDKRIYIPPDDVVRGHIFTDPAFGVRKKVVAARRQKDGTYSLQEYDSETEVRVTPDLEEVSEARSRFGTKMHRGGHRNIICPPELLPTAEKINFYHSQLKFSAGRLNDEYAEQAMAVEYLDSDAKVLEIGSNIGRNTLMIACLLADDRNLVTLECDPVSVEVLQNNRSANGFGFHIEPAALSYRKLIQKSWLTRPSDVLLEGYSWVRTTTFEALMDKYEIEFDTIVADCEGALYYILQDNPAILQNIKTVILESDYLDVTHKYGVEAVFREYGLEKVFHQPLVAGGPAELPIDCAKSFYEVWLRGAARYLPRDSSLITVQI